MDEVLVTPEGTLAGWLSVRAAPLSCSFSAAWTTNHSNARTHVSRPFFRAYPGQPTDTGKVKPGWILPRQETVSGSGISRANMNGIPQSEAH